MPITLPGSPSCVISLTCLGRPKGVRVRSGLRRGYLPGKDALTQAGQANNTTKASRQSNRHPPNNRSTQASQEVNTTSQEGNTSISLPSRPPQGSSKEEPNPKWIINLSNKPLTPAQRSVLAKGPNFVVTPRQPPNLEYITAIEAACTKLSQLC